MEFARYHKVPSPSPLATNDNGGPLPSSILIVGAGVFGLSTALSLARNPSVPKSTTITVLDRSPQPGVFPSRDASSIDTSRIIRADYADPAYAALAAEAQEEWRRPGGCGADGRYSECGLIITTDDDPATNPKNYARSSWDNVRALAAADPALRGKIQELPDPAAIAAAYGTGGGGSGRWGYINRNSGWADAERCMDWLHAQARATGRVTFVNGTAASLICSTYNRRTPEVRGVRLADGSELQAGLTVLAAGAWTPSLVDLGGRAVATGQVVAYVDLTPSEQASLEGIPTLLNLSTGYFIITPAGGTLKVARHSYGYLNPTPTPASAGGMMSAPSTHLTSPPTTSIPESDRAALRAAMCELVPSLPALRTRPFRETRLCWYTDTVDGDFIIDYHPDYRGLFLATGGSGHGFKFLPVIGDRIAQTMLGDCPAAFRGKWAFRKDGSERAASWDKVVTADGSRGGVPGLVLGEEMARKGQRVDQGTRTSRL
ncbi:hypothetical protein KVR01_000999 [Diaporthe batatas]|uniref:uncharacterized protein n=1 Tax=Diaporthe batatas TaxID=748121 RepID=UPI001D058ADA|nr:uncharacterized protein KVR01_000999 [Diaporthe batatas]KAG8170254.1 hypothetical protein KVR01_000999 [Diaporthe batatas]